MMGGLGPIGRFKKTVEMALVVEGADRISNGGTSENIGIGAVGFCLPGWREGMVVAASRREIMVNDERGELDRLVAARVTSAIQLGHQNNQ